MTNPVCPVCHNAGWSPKGLAIHMGMRHKPRRVHPIDVDRLWTVLSGIGVIEVGTWVSFSREDAELIAREYAEWAAAEGNVS